MDDHLPIGTLLSNQYRLTEIVGEGGMGVVYRAKQETVGRDVAVKILRARHAKDETVVQRFENEARIISQLRHPNTLRLYDTQRLETGGLFIVTEFLEGQSLEQLLRAGPLPLERVLSIADQICASLSEAHTMGVVHRDLKPGNIFLDRVGGEDFVKVLDFGIAKLQAGSIVKTQANVIMGTPAYMSPEQVKGEIADARSDIYAVGILIYQMLAGTPPFVAENPVTLLMKQVNDPPPPLAQKLRVPLELEALVFEMLSKHPDFRPQKITEARDRLRNIARATGAHLSHPATPPMMAQPPQPRQPSRAPVPQKYPAKERSDDMPTQPHMNAIQDVTLPPQPMIENISQIPVTISLEMDRAIDSSPPALEMFLDEGPPMHRQGSGEHAKSGNRNVILGAIAVVLVLGIVALIYSRPSTVEPAPETAVIPTPAPDPVPVLEKPIEKPIEKPVVVEQPKPVVVEEPEEPEEAAAPTKIKEKKKKKKKSSDPKADEELERAASKILTDPPVPEEEKTPEETTAPDPAKAIEQEPEPEPPPVETSTTGD